jgi:hypothetical protein
MLKIKENKCRPGYICKQNTSSKNRYMYKIILLLISFGSCLAINAQVNGAANGLSVNGTNAELGGTLNNAATSIDFGSGNSSSSLLFKKGTSNYFFMANDGKIGIGTNSPSTLFNVNGVMRVDGTATNQVQFTGNNSFNPGFVFNGSNSNLHVYTFDSQNFSVASDGNTRVSGSSSLLFYNTANIVAYQQPLTLKRSWPGTASGVGVIFDNDVLSAVPATYRIASFRLTGTEKAWIDQTGGAYFSADVLISSARSMTIGKAASTNPAANNANSAFGYSVLIANTSGNMNTGVGDRTLSSNTTGNYNTGIGTNALLSNNIGTGNAALGYRALESNTTGNYNTAIGYNALPTNSTGSQNTAVGRNALAANTASGNTAVGDIALGSNSSGASNTSIGYWSLYSNTTGNSNVADGALTLYNNNTGASNSAHGSQALYYNTSGNNNAALGSTALYNNATGSYNTAIGNGAGSNLTSGNNNIFIGSAVQPNISNTGSNQLNIGNWIYGDNGNIGIGVTAPSAHLHNNGSVRFQGLTQNNSLTNVVASDANGNLYLKDASSMGSTNWTTVSTNIYNNNTSGVVLIGRTTVPTVATEDQSGLRLAVEGIVYSKKVKVTQTGWADYVFHPGYKLPTLKEVEQFIEKNKHLPGVPTAAEVEQKGLDLGENQATLLKKVEELTLYMIELNKKVEKLAEENEALKKQLASQKN